MTLRPEKVMVKGKDQERLPDTNRTKRRASATMNSSETLKDTKKKQGEKGQVSSRSLDSRTKIECENKWYVDVPK